MGVLLIRLDRWRLWAGTRTVPMNKAKMASTMLTLFNPLQDNPMATNHTKCSLPMGQPGWHPA
jgi:hypothetical protein